MFLFIYLYTAYLDKCFLYSFRALPCNNDNGMHLILNYNFNCYENVTFKSYGTQRVKCVVLKGGGHEKIYSEFIV